MFDLSSIPLQSGQLALLTDRLGAPADFVLLDALASNLRKGRKCIFVSIAESIMHWTSLATKWVPSTDLNRHISSGSLVFVDGLESVQDSGLPDLHQIFKRISGIIESTDSQQAFVLIDGLTCLQWMGVSQTDTRRFLRALLSSCRQHAASLLIRHHDVLSGKLDELFRFLLEICGYHIEVLPLASGKSGTVTGQIALHKGPYSRDDRFSPIPRSRAIQYRLTDSKAVYFERGTAANVL